MQLSRKQYQIKKEYKILKYLDSYEIAPKAIFLDLKTFYYPLMIEEFIEGKSIKSLSRINLSKVGSIIAKLNKVQLRKDHPFKAVKPCYARDLKWYYDIFNKIKNDKSIEEWRNKTDTAFRELRKIVKENQKLLNKVKPAVIRRDANPTNFILTKNSIKLIDWEVVRVDDPTVTLASFINEVELYDYFERRLTSKQKEFLIDEYLKNNKVSRFKVLLENRLLLERIWGLVWALERIYLFRNKRLPKNLLKKSKLRWYKMTSSPT